MAIFYEFLALNMPFFFFFNEITKNRPTVFELKRPKRRSPFHRLLCPKAANSRRLERETPQPPKALKEARHPDTEDCSGPREAAGTGEGWR